MRRRLVRGPRRQDLIRAPIQPRVQVFRDRLGDFALDGKDIRQFAIVSFGPKVRIGPCVDELHVYPDRVACFLHAAFQDIGHPEKTRDLAHVFRLAPKLRGGRARDDFEITDLRQAGEDLILNAFAEIRVLRVAAEIFER